MTLKVDRNTKTLRELTLEKMRGAILSRHFQPGERLVERVLGEQLGVSRTVVREVLRHLETEGLVEIRPHQGPIVARLDPEQAAQIYELRAVLEALAVRACALNASVEDMEKLEQAMARIERDFETGDLSAVLKATTDFYESMFLSGGKSVAWSIVQSLNARISHMRRATLGSTERQATGPAEMRRIVAAIKERDAAAAEAACLNHVSQAARIALQIMSPSDNDVADVAVDGAE